MPSACATVTAACPPSVSADRSVGQTPSAKSTWQACATARANRVLPVPPGPTTVTTAWSRTQSRNSEKSVSRPISGGPAGMRAARTGAALAGVATDTRAAPPAVGDSPSDTSANM